MGRLIRYGPRRAQVIDVRPGEGHFEHIDPGSGAILQFFPPEAEKQLVQLEVRYKGLQPIQIRQTRFAVVPNGNGYTFKVLKQTAMR